MKKALAIVMALVIALSMSAMAFAAEGTGTTKALTETCGRCGSIFESAEDLRTHIALGCDGTANACPYCSGKFADEDAYNKHLEICPKLPAGETFRNECPICQREFADEGAYNDHIAICVKDKNSLIVDLTVKDLLTMIIDLVKINAGQWDAIESVVIRLVDFVENMGKGLVSQGEVEGAVADLEAELANFSIPGVDEILNTIKSKIKNMYAGEKATTVVVETTTETTTEETTTEAVVIEDTGSASVGIAAFAAISVAAAAAYVCTKKKA